MTVQRIQRQRTKGWRMPEGAVYVGRPSRWGNPWRVEYRAPRRDPWVVVRGHDDMRLYLGGFHDRATAAYWAARDYRRVATGAADLAEWLAPLQAATALACWCPLDQPCHADVLIELLEPRPIPFQSTSGWGL